MLGAPSPDVRSSVLVAAHQLTSRTGGTRLIPSGALKGVQFMETTDYIQVVGFIDQAQINIQAGDFGGGV